ncbi:MAG TPA: phosphatase PAP2 family protein [Gammaproteobacteria bacterium]|nr:phosphatase PAP2 family protein [Gammaproteobacteria bacterium]
MSLWNKALAGGRMIIGILRRNRNQLHTLLWLALLLVGAGVFIELADEVMAGETSRIDEYILLSLRNPADLSDPVGPGWVEEMGRDFSALGSAGVLAFITFATLGYLLLSRHYRSAVFTAIAISGGVLVKILLKTGFDRPRPELVPHETIVYSTSFPSGHSMMAAIVYLTLAALLARIHPQHALKAYLLSIAALITLLIGISRVYLGVHWPSDVLAGWAIGAAWAALCWLIAGWLQRRGMVESENG